MAKKQATKRDVLNARKSQKWIWGVSVSVFLVKIFWLLNLPNKGLLGADGENYLSGVSELVNDGMFSQATVLHYWPAGYPILLWPWALVSESNLLLIVGVLQSLLFSASVIVFALELGKSVLKKYALPSVWILSISPTLSLNSVVIGYEVPTASLLLIALTTLLRNKRHKPDAFFSWEIFVGSACISLACFMQPRIVLLAIGIIVPYAFYSFSKRRAIFFLAISVAVISIGPALLIGRNVVANNFTTVSTNLGVTMNIGAGTGASGGYTNDAKGVACTEIEGDAVQKDRHLTRCVIRWYLANPIEASTLMVNKFFFHWSPWFGPLTNGTMARNPWLEFHPLVGVAQNSQSGFDMVFGATGKVMSWIWEIGQLALIIIGFLALRRRGEFTAMLGWMLALPVMLNTISSMATIGDNRFRIPTLTLSVMLQLFGLYSIFQRREFQPRD